MVNPSKNKIMIISDFGKPRAKQVVLGNPHRSSEADVGFRT